MTDYAVTDAIDQELVDGDFVVFYSNIYRVKSVGRTKYEGGQGPVRMIIVNGGQNSRSVVKHSKDIAKLDQQQVLVWMLKKGYQ